MSKNIALLAEYGWVAVAGSGQPCLACQKPVVGTAVLHPRTFRHLHIDCALRVSGLRNISPVADAARVMGALGGAATKGISTPAKRRAARRNAKLGGRPRKSQTPKL